jgi:MFS family permease
LSVFRIPAFRRLVVAWSFSNFGDSALYLTLAIWAKDLTDSDAAAGLVFLFLGLPVFLAPFAGQLADRYSRRRIVVSSNLVAAVVVLSLWFVEGPSQMWLIYLVTFLYGLLTYVTSAAGSGLVRDMLADDQLAEGNGILKTIDQGLRLLSPLVGAGVYAAFGGFAISVVTFVMLGIAALLMFTLRLEESPPDERGAFWDELTAGFRHIRRVPLLARMTLAMGAAFAMTGFASTTSFAVIEQGLGRPTEFYGVLAAVQGGGSILGGITAAALIHRLGERKVVAVGLAILGIGLGGMAVPHVWVVIGCEVLVGLSIPWFIVGFVTLRQKLTPNRLQGRVSAFTSMALNGPQVGGTASGAVLIGFVDYRVLVIAMGLSVALCALAILPSRPQLAEEAGAA